MLRFAAIDIGSNAMRILFEQVIETPDGPIFKKLSLIRLPVRLGDDAFLRGSISKKKEEHLIDLAHAYNHLSRIFEVDHFRATATSAMRDSSNGPAIIERIKSEVGIDIEIIPGEEEAQILYESIFNTGKIDEAKSYMFIDVGGGSTEINFYENGERKKWRSFDLGSVRLKEGVVKEETIKEFESWISENAKIFKPAYAVGTGGNINKLYKLCGLVNWKNLHRNKLKKQIDFLETISQEEMINKHDIKPDRADVIVPGGMVYFQAMKVAGIAEMIVPKVGLADGLIRRLYLEAQSGK